MRAMILDTSPGALRLAELPVPRPGTGQILLRVAACGVCRTDLHVIDGELRHPALPLIPGHEVVGTVVELGSDVEGIAVGDRVGVPWLGWTCGECRWCRSGRENLCPAARFTGYQIDGGYAEFAVADARYCFPLPADIDDEHAAPLMCAGLIGYRSLKLAGDARCLGLYGFGAAAHIVAQLARHDGRTVFAFTRPGDTASQEFARSLGAGWAGGADEAPPEELDAAIIFAPVGSLVPEALSRVAAGGRVVCAGIHMSEIPAFAYELLWHERSIASVANLTRADGAEFLSLAGSAGIHTTTTAYDLAQALTAIEHLRSGQLQGAAVLMCGNNPATV